MEFDNETAAYIQDLEVANALLSMSVESLEGKLAATQAARADDARMISILQEQLSEFLGVH